MADNKVQFGLSKVYYAICDDGNYATPVAFPGAVSLTLDVEGDQSNFYADNVPYYVTNTNSGYSGTLTMAYLFDSVAKDLLGMTVDANGILVESTTDTPAEFALLYQVEGDQAARRYIFYNAVLSRPNQDANTTEDTTTPDTVDLDITFTAREFSWGSDTKNFVKGSCEASASAYDGWYTKVQEPEAVPSA